MDVNSDVGALVNTFIQEINLAIIEKLLHVAVCGFQFTFCVEFTAQMCKMKRLKSGSTSTNNLGVLFFCLFVVFFRLKVLSEFVLWFWMFCLNVGLWKACHFTLTRKALDKLDSESCFQTG